VLLINTWTLLEHELSPSQRLFGIVVVAIIASYLVFLPHWLEEFPAQLRSWAATLIKVAANVVWLWPIVALLDIERILHLGLGILPVTLLWCLYAAVVMTAVAYGLIHRGKPDRGGGSPPAFQPQPTAGPTPPPSPADLFRLLPRSKPIDPMIHQCIESAHGEAARLGHSYIGTEHLLLGLLKGAKGSFAHVLQKLELNCEAVRMEIERMVSPAPASALTPAIPFTPRARRAIRLAGHEANAMKHSLIGVEDLLIGLLREGSGVGAQALRNLGVRLENARAEIIRESNSSSIL